jgi:ATP-dependent Clp protease ATP-binding subunit ClpC
MVATSLRRARAEMRDIKRPIVNLLFLGPTGVGKTELA